MVAHTKNPLCTHTHTHTVIQKIQYGWHIVGFTSPRDFICTSRIQLKFFQLRFFLVNKLTLLKASLRLAVSAREVTVNYGWLYLAFMALSHFHEGQVLHRGCCWTQVQSPNHPAGSSLDTLNPSEQRWHYASNQVQKMHSTATVQIDTNAKIHLIPVGIAVKRKNNLWPLQPKNNYNKPHYYGSDTTDSFAGLMRCYVRVSQFFCLLVWQTQSSASDPCSDPAHRQRTVPQGCTPAELSDVLI